MSGENVKIEKIRKSSKAAQIVSNIGKIIMIACSAASILGGCVIFGFTDELNQIFAEAINHAAFREKELDALERVVGTAVIEDGRAAQTLGTYVFTAGIIMICTAVVLHFVSRTFKCIRESYSPFCPEIIKNLKISFVLMTVLTLRSSVLIGLLIGLAGWCVISIFEYGYELQIQSDETL